ncbi:hypothetical protein [Treponema bryantii]|uniref:hypothetical protein n=1 Tax=Treponema bryantii TaxID=163 RepID=UPI0003B6F803|nr:hypothetical protein [Treponema bryantii]
MRKSFFVCIFIIFNVFYSFAQSIPSRLLGIWEAKDRYVFFEQNDEEKPEIVIVLKTYYGWYLNRAAEPASYNEKEARVRNTANARNAEHIYIQNVNTKETNNSIYGSLDLAYSTWQKNTIPFLVIDNAMYLSYFEKDIHEEEMADDLETQEMTQEGRLTPSWTFYRGIAPSQGFMLSPQSIPENITGYIIDGDKLYDVRYWRTDMDYSTDYINFTYQNDTYQIPKHLRSCNTNYSCVSGRSKKVRNTVKPFEYKAEDFIFNDDASVFTKNEEPYLKQLADKNTFEELIKIIKDANSRRKPDPPALFPESNLDWHWDLIDLLEKDNKLIHAVRERQKNFGPRGRDRGK